MEEAAVAGQQVAAASLATRSSPVGASPGRDWPVRLATGGCERRPARTRLGGPCAPCRHRRVAAGSGRSNRCPSFALHDEGRSHEPVKTGAGGRRGHAGHLGGDSLARGRGDQRQRIGPRRHRGLGVSGTRTVISSEAVAKGVVRGMGEIVGMPRQPSDPANVSRADLVYPEGTMHLVGMTVDASSSVDPHSCLFRATTQEPRTSPAVPGCSPMRLAPSPARSVPRGCWAATPTAAAPSGNHCCRRWTWSRSAGHCRSDPF